MMPSPTPASTASARPRSRFVALFVYTMRSCFPLKRWAAVLLPCAGVLLFGLLTHAADTTPDRAFANIAAQGIFSLVVPIAALVIGDSVLGAEVRAGTFQFTWLSPAPISQIVLARWLGGVAVALVSIVPSCALVVATPSPSVNGREAARLS
jgi:ABC-type transport system involved in multi-copper enzyme maturation permease subunit